MKKIIGIKKSEGDYNGQPYCNYSVYYKELELVKDSVGEIVEKLTIKGVYLDDILKARNLDSFVKLVGIQFNEIYYDKYQKVRAII